MSERQTIKVGNFKVEIYPWKHPKGHSYWRWDHVDHRTGKRGQITASTPEKLVSRIGRILAGSIEPEKLPPSVRARLTHILAADPMLTGYMTFLEWQARQSGSVMLWEAVEEFMALKEANRGLSNLNVKGLRHDLDNLKAAFTADTKLAGITVEDMEGWMSQHAAKSPNRRRNIRAVATNFFRWARRRKYLSNEITAAEMLEAPKVGRKIPATLTVEEMRTLLAACPREFAPWLVMSGFHGIRSAELSPARGSDKSPLMWSDIDRERMLVTVRPETAKMGERRLIPLQPGSLKWFPEEAEGRVAPLRSLYNDTRTEKSMTTRLGALIGGWRPNALRHSFISYRAAIVGLAQTAMEAGNSEREARRDYHDAKPRSEAEAWFRLLDVEHL